MAPPDDGVARSKRMWSVLVTAGFVVAALAAAPWLVAEAKRAPDAGAASPTSSRCRTDADCVLVPDDCCGCNEGGAQRAVAKKDRDAYEKARTQRCSGTMCAQMMSQHPSCTQSAVCRAGACALGLITKP